MVEKERKLRSNANYANISSSFSAAKQRQASLYLVRQEGRVVRHVVEIVRRTSSPPSPRWGWACWEVAGAAVRACTSVASVVSVVSVAPVVSAAFVVSVVFVACVVRERVALEGACTCTTFVRMVECC